MVTAGTSTPEADYRTGAIDGVSRRPSGKTLGESMLAIFAPRAVPYHRLALAGSCPTASRARTTSAAVRNIHLPPAGPQPHQACCREQCQSYLLAVIWCALARKEKGNANRATRFPGQPFINHEPRHRLGLCIAALRSGFTMRDAQPALSRAVSTTWHGRSICEFSTIATSVSNYNLYRDQYGWLVAFIPDPAAHLGVCDIRKYRSC